MSFRTIHWKENGDQCWSKKTNDAPLNPFLPYITTASFTLFENDLHYCLDVGNDDFQFRWCLQDLDRKFGIVDFRWKRCLGVLLKEKRMIRSRHLTRQGCMCCLVLKHCERRKFSLLRLCVGMQYSYRRLKHLLPDLSSVRTWICPILKSWVLRHHGKRYVPTIAWL